MKSLVDVISSPDWLHRAWCQVRSDLSCTKWKHLSAEIADFDFSPLDNIKKLSINISNGDYVFGQKIGYARKKSGGSRRGITVHLVLDRIVQRAILNIFNSSRYDIQQNLGKVRIAMEHPGCIGGTPGRGVQYGVMRALEIIKNGAIYFAYSDVKDFFPRVPRAEAVEFVRSSTADDAFANLLEKALETELINSSEMERWSILFPTGSEGVPQGGLLSVLAGNLCMRKFDAELNTNGINCLRYLDDFLILGSSQVAVESGFAHGLELLKRMGMTAYMPEDGSHKAFAGSVASGFDFLGCRIRGVHVSPARRSKQKFLRELRHLLIDSKRSIQSFSQDDAPRRYEDAYFQTLVKIDKKVRGWGDAYGFINDRLSFAQVDDRIDSLLAEYADWMRRRLTRTSSDRIRRRMEGVSLLSDTPVKSIVKLL